MAKRRTRAARRTREEPPPVEIGGDPALTQQVNEAAPPPPPEPDPELLDRADDEPDDADEGEERVSARDLSVLDAVGAGLAAEQQAALKRLTRQIRGRIRAGAQRAEEEQRLTDLATAGQPRDFGPPDYGLRFGPPQSQPPAPEPGLPRLPFWQQAAVSCTEQNTATDICIVNRIEPAEHNGAELPMDAVMTLPLPTTPEVAHERIAARLGGGRYELLIKDRDEGTVIAMTTGDQHVRIPGEPRVKTVDGADLQRQIREIEAETRLTEAKDKLNETRAHIMAKQAGKTGGNDQLAALMERIESRNQQTMAALLAVLSKPAPPAPQTDPQMSQLLVALISGMQQQAAAATQANATLVVKMFEAKGTGGDELDKLKKYMEISQMMGGGGGGGEGDTPDYLMKALGGLAAAALPLIAAKAAKGGTELTDEERQRLIALGSQQTLDALKAQGALVKPRLRRAIAPPTHAAAPPPEEPNAEVAPGEPEVTPGAFDERLRAPQQPQIPQQEEPPMPPLDAPQNFPQQVAVAIIEEAQAGPLKVPAEWAKLLWSKAPQPMLDAIGTHGLAAFREIGLRDAPQHTMHMLRFAGDPRFQQWLAGNCERIQQWYARTNQVAPTAPAAAPAPAETPKETTPNG